MTRMKRTMGADRRILSYPFGLTDDAGRSMGLSIELGESELVEVDGEALAYMEGETDDLGTWYGFRPHTTRDGKGFGATQEWRWFRRKDERAAAVLKYTHLCKTRAFNSRRSRVHSDPDPDT